QRRAAAAAAAEPRDVSYASERAAALAFVAAARARPDQRLEYCAYVLRGADGRYRFGTIYRGDMDQCDDGPPPADAAAGAHTHPIWGRPDDPSADAQSFSDKDFDWAEWYKLPLYLGAPDGAVLRYAPGHTLCRGTTLMRRDFEIVRDLRPSVADEMAVRPGAWTPLFDEAGNPLPRPSYCRREP
ncbi:MAG: DUF4329 domain-containing protein, partial [Elusimicrobia bacterium]|nr:DUF4329 domain-containing protein [Elusimicrobiota bacterium]